MEYFLFAQTRLSRLASGAARLALRRIERSRLEFAIEQAGGIDRPRQADAPARNRPEAHAGVVGLVADQDHERPARRLRRLERAHHQRLADALAAEYGLDDKRSEEKRRPASDFDRRHRIGA